MEEKRGDKNMKSDFTKGVLATIDKSFVDKFKEINAIMESIANQRLQLQSLEAEAILSRGKLWDQITELYNLPGRVELERDCIDLRVEFSTGKVIITKRIK